jgi:hypothetical protein
MAGCRRRKSQFKYARPRRRRDLMRRLVVDIGISYAESLGKSITTEFLRQCDIPDAVIHRVLLGTKLQ